MNNKEITFTTNTTCKLLARVASDRILDLIDANKFTTDIPVDMEYLKEEISKIIVDTMMGNVNYIDGGV